MQLWHRHSPGKENVIENLAVQRDGEQDALKQAKGNPDFLLRLHRRSPSSLCAGQAWQGTAAVPGVSTWLLIKGALSNQPLHISRSCCQEPRTSTGWETTDKAAAEKSGDACIGQSECCQWLLENVIFIWVLQLHKPDLLKAHSDTAVVQGLPFGFLFSKYFI